jgi:hypothetical protein
MTANENADAANVGDSETPALNQDNYTGISAHQQFKSTALIYSFAEFMARQFSNGEEIAFDVRRGELALVASKTNVGKSTLVRNALLALATGSEFPPLVPEGRPRRVLLVDFETSSSRLQSDLATMTKDWPTEKRALLDENLFIICDGIIGDDLFSLSHHIGLIEGFAKRQEVDLIVVDTAAAGFDLRDENSNSEVARDLLKPLVRLSRSVGCVVVLLHHIGKAKSEDGRDRDAVHQPRGASAFSAYAASVFVLEPDVHHQDTVTLSCAKRKSGENYEYQLELNRDRRWFKCGEEIQRGPTAYEKVLWVVLGTPGEVKRSTINAALEAEVRERTITRCLARAVERGEIISPKKGLYVARRATAN